MILQWAERENRILVSNDRATLGIHLIEHLASGQHSPGIFFVPRSLWTKPIINALVLYAYASELEEWRDRIEYLSS